MNEWISAKIRMPTKEDGRKFLVWDGSSREMAYMSDGWFSYANERLLGYEKHITHWVSLPEPPPPVKDGWIPTKDLMPAIGQEVLLKIHYKHTNDLVEARHIAIGRALGEGSDPPWYLTHLHLSDTKHYGIAEVVAWQPLPD